MMVILAKRRNKHKLARIHSLSDESELSKAKRWKDVKIFTLTLDILKQIRGHHGCLRYKCPICHKEFDENDVGQTIVSLIYPDKNRINPNKPKHLRIYVHKRCYEGLWHE